MREARGSSSSGHPDELEKARGRAFEIIARGGPTRRGTRERGALRRPVRDRVGRDETRASRARELVGLWALVRRHQEPHDPRVAQRCIANSGRRSLINQVDDRVVAPRVYRATECGKLAPMRPSAAGTERGEAVDMRSLAPEAARELVTQVIDTPSGREPTDQCHAPLQTPATT